LELAEKIDESDKAAICALNLGQVYTDLATLRDLAQAEQWYRRSLELRPKENKRGQAISLGQLGAVAWERFEEARAAKQSSESEAQAEAALQHYHQALTLLPADAVNDLAVVHNQLGMIYGTIGQLEPALHHNQEYIRLNEEGGNHYGAARTRYNVAIDLLQAQRLPDALSYARAALRGFQRYGERAQRDIDKTQALIDRIEQAGSGVQR
jgi:tetratricopeptide (TPR) repeat protein